MNIMHILLIMLVSLFLLFLLYQFRELNQKKRALFNLIIQFRNHFEFNEELEEILNDKDYLIDELNDVIECYENKELEDTEEIINQNIF